METMMEEDALDIIEERLCKGFSSKNKVQRFTIEIYNETLTMRAKDNIELQLLFGYRERIRIIMEEVFIECGFKFDDTTLLEKSIIMKKAISNKVKKVLARTKITYEDRFADLLSTTYKCMAIALNGENNE